MPRPKVYADTADRMRAYRERKAKARAEELQQKGIPGTASIGTMPSSARWTGLIANAHAAIQTAHDEIEAYIGDRTDAWTESDRGQELQARLDALADILAALDELP